MLNTIKGVIKCIRIDKHPIEELNGNWYLSLLKVHRFGFDRGGMSAVISKNIACSLVLPFRSDLEENLNGIELELYDDDMLEELCIIESYYDRKDNEHKYALCEVTITELIINKTVTVELDDKQPIFVPKLLLPNGFTKDTKLKIEEIRDSCLSKVKNQILTYGYKESPTAGFYDEPQTTTEPNIDSMSHKELDEMIQEAYEKSSLEIWNTPENVIEEEDVRNETID